MSVLGDYRLYKLLIVLMNKNKAIAAMLLAGGVSVTIYLIRFYVQDGTQDIVAPVSASESVTSELGKILTAHRELMDDAVAATDAEALLGGFRERESVKRSQVVSKAEPTRGWPFDYPRTRFDLRGYGMARMGYFRVRDLVRHIKLNRSDAPIGHRDLAELEFLVDILNKKTKSLLDNYRKMRCAEMMSLIEAGRVRPAKVPDLSEAQWTYLAEQLASTDEYKKKGMGVAQVSAMLKKGPRPTAFVGESNITHNGKCYLYSQFGKLPNSDGVYEDLKFFAFECIGTLGSWFVGKGFMLSEDLTTILGSIERLDPVRQRQVSVRRRR